MTMFSCIDELLELRKGINMLILYLAVAIVIVALSFRTWNILEDSNLKLKEITPTEIVMYTLAFYLLAMIARDLIH